MKNYKYESIKMFIQKRRALRNIIFFSSESENMLNVPLFEIRF